MLSLERVDYLRSQGRYIDVAETGDEDLGPLKLLPGTWKNTGDFVGRGWNSIALPFAQPSDGSPRPIDYRLLVNQFNEELKFTLVDKAVPNRGISRLPSGSTNTDQFVVTLDYEQMIKQIKADDNPLSGLAGPGDLAIHHEPGLWLHMTNLTTNDRDIGRLGTIPHGDSLLALGTSATVDGSPVVPEINGLPVGGGPQDLENNGYLSPYKHFNDTPFVGDITFPGFPGFNPVKPNGLLIGGLPQNVKRTTVLHVDTTFEQAGISNIPFIVKQANATTMNSTFWIMELDEDDGAGSPKLVLAYSQFIMLEFFRRFDGVDGLIQWPHVSINVMEKVKEADTEKAQMPAT